MPLRTSCLAHSEDQREQLRASDPMRRRNRRPDGSMLGAQGATRLSRTRHTPGGVGLRPVGVRVGLEGRVGCPDGAGESRA
jgi:hypothetical protein